MATHSSILAWETPWMEEPGGLQFTHGGSKRVGHDTDMQPKKKKIGKNFRTMIVGTFTYCSDPQAAFALTHNVFLYRTGYNFSSFVILSEIL